MVVVSVLPHHAKMTYHMEYIGKSSGIVLQESLQILVHCVDVNHGYDTYFRSGLVMDYVDCKCSSGLVETSK